MRRKTALGWAMLVALAVSFVLAAGIPDPFELPLRDFTIRLLPGHDSDHTVVVAIDEASLRSIGPWPWPRTTVAALVQRIAQGRARAVALDILLADPRDGDHALAAAMQRLPTICVAALDERGEWLLPAPALRSSTIAAHGNFELDHDGILRRFAATKQSVDRSLVAMSVEAASLVTGAPVAVGTTIVPAFRTPAHSVMTISAGDLLRSPVSDQGLRGKLVFVGPTAFGLGDRVLTPTSAFHRPDPGVTVHAAAAESIIHGDDIRTLPPLGSGLLSGLALFLVISGGRPLWRALWTITALVVIGPVLLGAASVSVPVVTLIVVVALAAALVEGLHVLRTMQRSRSAAATMEQRLGIAPESATSEVGPRMESIATQLGAQRDRELEARRVLAHELRTPLASMRGLSELLSDFALTEAERHRVGALLQGEAAKLESLVGGLLEIERLPLRDFFSSTTTVDLGSLVDARVAFLRAGTDRPLLLQTRGGVYIRAEAALLDRVLDNLVGNALKYTTSTVTVRVLDQGSLAVLEVEDCGDGIADNDRARIFERFVRGATAAGTQGLGLGLSLVAEVARWHAGSVSVETVGAGGSLFRVTFPRLAESREEAR